MNYFDSSSQPGNKKSVPARMPSRPVPFLNTAPRALPVAASAAEVPEQPLDVQPRSWVEAGNAWVAEAGGAYVASMLFHSALLLLLFLVLGVRYVQQKLAAGPAFEAVELAASAPPLDPDGFKFDNGLSEERHKLDPNDLVPKFDRKGDETSTRKDGSENKLLTEYIDDNHIAKLDGGPGFDGPQNDTMLLRAAPMDLIANRSGPAVTGISGIAPPQGTGNEPGFFGNRKGFGPGGQGGPVRSGTTRTNEFAVALALDWLARHQNRDGSWSLSRFHTHCKSQACSGAGNAESDAAATALALLPFLAAGNTHREGTYQAHVYRGIFWLMSHQNRNTGDLSAGSGHVMYTHGLATIALCEAYGMTNEKDKYKDKVIQQSAQSAINFIQNAQDKSGGGWRYKPGESGDTSVVGWQVMALKSGQIAGLQVHQPALDGARKYLAAASGSQYGGRFGYTPGTGSTPTMSSVGLLCTQYLGAARDNPGLVDGTKYLLENRPDINANRNTYYWYYATQVLHNMQGVEWDSWDLKMRSLLKKSQVREGCAAGSWDPDRPSADAWGQAGGRVMMTSLSCLTLEVYYRYLPLYDLTKKGAVKDLDATGNATAR